MLGCILHMNILEVQLFWFWTTILSRVYLRLWTTVFSEKWQGEFDIFHFFRGKSGNRSFFLIAGFPPASNALHTGLLRDHGGLILWFLGWLFLAGTVALGWVGPCSIPMKKWLEDGLKISFPLQAQKHFQLAMVTRKYAWCTQHGLLPSYCINEVKQKTL